MARLNTTTIDIRSIQVVKGPDDIYRLNIVGSGRDSDGRRINFTTIPLENEGQLTEQLINMVIRELRFLTSEGQI